MKLDKLIELHLMDIMGEALLCHPIIENKNSAKSAISTIFQFYG